MRTRTNAWAVAGLLLLSASSPLAKEPVSADVDDEIVVIVNATNPVTKLTATQVSDRFLKKATHWKNESGRVRPVDLEPTEAIRDTFLDEILDMTSDEVERYWITMRYTNGTSEPRVVSTNEAVLKFVSVFEGGIGYVAASAITEEASQKVRVVHRVAR